MHRLKNYLLEKKLPDFKCVFNVLSKSILPPSQKEIKE